VSNFRQIALKRFWVFGSVPALLALLALAAATAPGDAGQATEEDAARTAPTAGSAAVVDCGDVNASGAITSSDLIYMVNYVFKGGAMPNCPSCVLAGGVVGSAGTILNSGTDNWSVAWNAAGQFYDITITGESYLFSGYHTTVSTLGGTARVEVNSSGGALRISFYNTSSDKVQMTFSFSTIKL
jgi:hypothetical protein